MKPVSALRNVALVASAAVSLALSPGVAVGQAHQALDGLWMGSGALLFIDADRAQARIDPRRPFQWEAFAIRNVEENMIVFMIGPQLFIAYVDGENLMLTSPGSQQPSALHRISRTPS